MPCCPVLHVIICSFMLTFPIHSLTLTFTPSPLLYIGSLTHSHIQHTHIHAQPRLLFFSINAGQVYGPFNWPKICLCTRVCFSAQSLSQLSPELLEPQEGRAHCVLTEQESLLLLPSLSRCLSLSPLPTITHNYMGLIVEEDPLLHTATLSVCMANLLIHL